MSQLNSKSTIEMLSPLFLIPKFDYDSKAKAQYGRRKYTSTCSLLHHYSPYQLISITGSLHRPFYPGISNHSMFIKLQLQKMTEPTLIIASSV